MEYDKEELLKQIKDFYETNNYMPTKEDFNNNVNGFNTEDYLKVFRTWTKVIKQTCLIYFSGLKMCPKCRKLFPANNDYFAKDNRNADGLQTYCKTCKSIDKQRHYDENKDWYKDYYKNNHVYSKLGQITNSLKSRGYPNITKDQVNQIIDNFKNKENVLICPYCGREILEDSMVHFDHFVPYSLVNNNLSLSAIIPVCKYCNRSKWDEQFQEWYKQQFFYNPIREQELMNYVRDGQLVPFYK